MKITSAKRNPDLAYNTEDIFFHFLKYTFYFKEYLPNERKRETDGQKLEETAPTHWFTS